MFESTVYNPYSRTNKFSHFLLDIWIIKVEYEEENTQISYGWNIFLFRTSCGLKTLSMRLFQCEPIITFNCIYMQRLIKFSFCNDTHLPCVSHVQKRKTFPLVLLKKYLVMIDYCEDTRNIKWFAI